MSITKRGKTKYEHICKKGNDQNKRVQIYKHNIQQIIKFKVPGYFQTQLSIMISCIFR